MAASRTRFDLRVCVRVAKPAKARSPLRRKRVTRPRYRLEAGCVTVRPAKRTPTVTDGIMASVPVNDAGIGSAMKDLSRELGLTLGVATLGSIGAGIYRSDVIEALRGLVPGEAAETISDSIGVVGVVTADLPPDVAVAVTDAANMSFVGALNIGFLGAAGFVALALVVAVFLIPRRMRSLQGGLSDEPECELAPAPLGRISLATEEGLDAVWPRPILLSAPYAARCHR